MLQIFLLLQRRWQRKWQKGRLIIGCFASNRARRWDFRNRCRTLLLLLWCEVYWQGIPMTAIRPRSMKLQVRWYSDRRRDRHFAANAGHSRCWCYRCHEDIDRCCKWREARHLYRTEAVVQWRDSFLLLYTTEAANRHISHCRSPWTLQTPDRFPEVQLIGPICHFSIIHFVPIPHSRSAGHPLNVTTRSPQASTVRGRCPICCLLESLCGECLIVRIMEWRSGYLVCSNDMVKHRTKNLHFSSRDYSSIKLATWLSMCAWHGITLQRSQRLVELVNI